MKIIPSRIKHFSQFIKCIVYCLKVFGLAPFSVRIETSTTNNRNPCTWVVEFSKIGLGYNFFISILIPSSTVCGFLQTASIDYINKSHLTQATVITGAIFMTTAAFVILIYWTFKQMKAITIINRLLDMDAQLSCTEMPPSYKKSLIFLFVHLIMNILLWITLWTTALNNILLDLDKISAVIFSPLSSVVICLYFVEYSMIVGLVTSELKSVNENLLHFRGVQNHASIDSLPNPLPALSSSIIHGQLASLQSLESIRMKLSQVSEDISNFFSFPILLCFAFSFFLIVSELYYLIIPVIHPNGTFSLIQSILIVDWLIIVFYPITSLLLNVTEAVYEVMRDLYSPGEK